MKRGRPPPRQAAPPEQDSDDEAPSEEELGPQSKRQAGGRRMVPEYGSTDSGDSQSDSEASDSSDGEAGAGAGGEDEGPTLGQLVALRQDGSTSAAAMKARARAARQAAAAGTFKRGGKHRPAEISSKRPVPVLRDTLQGGKREARDPRFESLSAGQYSEEQFKRRYAFLYDEKLPEERAELRAALKKAKGAGARAELQARLTRVEQQLRSEEARRKREGFKQQVKAKERAAVKDGKSPFFLKKSEQRRLELLAKYEELKASGKLDKFMAKRRKKNAAKSHKHLPGARRNAGGDQ
ncbi:hypothetical protein ABPG75_012941 [Micractinium tetrahymenae]